MTFCESIRGEWGDICPDCGNRLPERLPWSHGRPCELTSLDRGRGWDGRPLPQHSAGNSARWGTRGLSQRQLEIKRIVAKHDGNIRSAARELGIAPATVHVSLKRSRAAV